MIARVLRVELQPETVDAVVTRYRQIVRPIHERAAGLEKHYVLVDRASGRLMIIGVWSLLRRCSKWRRYSSRPASGSGARSG